MIPIRNRKKTLQVTVDEMRNFALSYVEKYAPSKQQIKDELKKFTDEAFGIDVFGAPTFVVNKKIFWGQDRLEYALDECNFKQS